jgi:hypothetical protein
MLADVSRLPALGAAALAGALVLSLPGLASGRDPVIVYSPMAGATALHDRTDASTLRQAPVLPNRRWPANRLVGKLNGKELSKLSTVQIAARMRAAWRDPSTGSRVAIDEIAPTHWDLQAAKRLRAAMIRLGADRRRITFYAAPSMVEQVGRRDPRRALAAKHRTLIDAMSRGRATYLLTYRGNLQPFPAKEMATHPTRWLARWPAGRGSLHLMLGPDGGIGQAALWNRVRASAAGRKLLANGPAAYGLRTSAVGRAWAVAYTNFLGAPTAAPPGGDYPVPVPGGLALKRSSRRTVEVTAARRGRVVVSMKRLAGGATRAIKKLTAPRATTRVAIPGDARPGKYRVTAVLQGDGLKDRKAVIVTVARQKVKLAYASGVFTLTVPRGARAVLSLLPPNGKRRAIGKAVGPRTKRIPLPKGLRAGRYTAVASTSGAGGQKPRVSFRVTK